jgi:hypothetical protein
MDSPVIAFRLVRLCPIMHSDRARIRREAGEARGRGPAGRYGLRLRCLGLAGRIVIAIMRRASSSETPIGLRPFSHATIVFRCFPILRASSSWDSRRRSRTARSSCPVTRRECYTVDARSGGRIRRAFKRRSDAKTERHRIERLPWPPVLGQGVTTTLGTARCAGSLLSFCRRGFESLRLHLRSGRGSQGVRRRSLHLRNHRFESDPRLQRERGC